MEARARRALGLLLILCGVVWMQPASAIPAFARKYELNCSSCHTAYPQLNSTGRSFKEAGYRFPSDTGDKELAISDFLHLEKHVPLSASLVARPYDKKDSGDTKIRALHEVEVFVAGVIGKQWSGYFEMETEDEDGFSPSIKPAVLNYNYRPELNVQFAYAPIFWADPYGILGDHFRLTRGHLGAIDQAFGGADGASGKLRSNRQTVGLYGRIAKRLFYNVNWSGDADVAEGDSASTFSGVLDFDITDNIMVGVFGMDGKNENTGGTSLDYSRYGLQAQADVADGRIQAIWVTAKDDMMPLSPGLPSPGQEDNDAYSIQAFWTFKDETMRPTVVPLVRLDHFEKNDGRDGFDELVLNVGYYFTQNVKGFVEYWDRYDAPTSAQEDNRFTLQLQATF